MAITRYDHRKLAFEKRAQLKKRRRSSFGEDDVVMGNGEDCLLGALGARQGAKSQQSSKWRKVVYNKNEGKGGHKQQGLTPATPNKDGSVASLVNQKRRSSSTFGNKRNNMADMFYHECMDMIDEAFSSHEDLNNNEMDQITLHLQMKQKNREKEKTAEEYMEIKTRMTDIMENFEGEPDDDEDDYLYGLGDEEEGRDLRQEIWEIIKAYEEVCRERENVLLNVYSDFDNEDEINAAAGDSFDIETYVENSEDDIDQTVSTLDQRTRKNKELHDKLIRIFREGRRSSKFNEEMEGQLRELKLQKNVVGQFKKLQANKEDRKEKLNTWKYAATEIVDLLQTVRKEGATDIERLESEFSKLLGAFKAQSELAEKFEEKLEKQKLIVKQTEEQKKKVTLENVSLQDEYDRCRTKLKTVEIKCMNLEGQVKQAVAKEAVQESAPKVDTPSRIALKDDVSKLTGEVKMYKDQCEKEKAERERVERLAAEKASFYENRNQEETNNKSKERNETPEVIKTVIEECANCAHAEERVKELTTIEATDKKEIAKLRLECEELSSKLHDNDDDDHSNVDDNVASSTNVADIKNGNIKTSSNSTRSTKKSRNSKNRDNNNQDVKEDTLKIPKKSRAEKRNSKINLKKSGSNLSVAVSTTELTPSPSREVITEIKYVEKIKSVVKFDKTTQASFAPPARTPVEQTRQHSNGRRSFNQSAPSTPGTPGGFNSIDSNHNHDEEQQDSGSCGDIFAGLNLGGGSTVDQEFSRIAKRILGYVRVVDEMGGGRDSREDDDQGDNPDTPDKLEKSNAQTANIVNNIFRPTSQKQPLRAEASAPSSEQKLVSLESEAIKENETSGDESIDAVGDIRLSSSQYEKTVGKQEKVDQGKQDSVHQDKDESVHQSKKKSEYRPLEEHSHGRTDATKSDDQQEREEDDSFEEVKKVFDPEKKAWVPADRQGVAESVNDAAATARRTSVSLRHESRRYSMPTNTTMFSYKEQSVQEETDIQSSWDESGFFDEEKEVTDDCLPSLSAEGSENEPKKHWNVLKSSGKARQLLRFLTTIGNKKCSHISDNMHDAFPKGHLDKEIASKLRVYASHAVDMLGVISFAVKKLQLKYTEGEDKPSTIMTKLKEHWKPVDVLRVGGNGGGDQSAPPVVHARRRSSMMPTNDAFVPLGQGGSRRQTVRLMSPHQRHLDPDGLKPTRLPMQDGADQTFGKPRGETSPGQSANGLRTNQPSPSIEEKERLAKIAEKKRLKILERHKKLVDRLRAGGASTKQIYAILGISKKGDDADGDSKPEGLDRVGRRTTIMGEMAEAEEKKFSIVGNGVRQRRLGFTSDMHNRNGVMNFNHQMNMKNRMMGMNNHRGGGMMGMNRGGDEGLMGQSPMMGINTSAVSRDTPRMIGFPQANTNNYQSHGYGSHNRGFVPNRLGAQRNQVVFPSINNNKNVVQTLGVASTPLTSLNFFKTKPINNARR